MIYAERPVRVAWQVISDLLAVAWLVFWGYAAWSVYAEVLRLRAPGEHLVSAGNQIWNGFNSAADQVIRVPFVGGDISSALRGGTGAGDSMRDAGLAQISAVEDLAVLLAALVIVVPVSVLLVVWLPFRVRFVLGARSLRRLRLIGAWDLLALRALNRLSARKLAPFGTDPAAAWRRADPDVIDRLAVAELSAFGLRR
jgi:hypothetical protein